MKVLIVGMNPGSCAIPRKNTALGRLHRWVEHLGIRSFHFTNVVLTPGAVSPSTVDWAALRTRIAGEYDRVLALGGFASNALKKIGVEHHRLPHPSYRNRTLNDPAYEYDELERARAYLEGARVSA